MDERPDTQRHPDDAIWIISSGRPARYDLDPIYRDGGPRPVEAQEYRISTLGRYLLCPAPIVFSSRLVGCRIFRRQSMLAGWKQRLKVWQKQSDEKSGEPEFTDLISCFSPPLPLLDTPELDSYLISIYDQLRPYDQLLVTLAELDQRKVADVQGICDDEAGNRTMMQVAGDISRQLAFIQQNLNQNVELRLGRAHISQGLFEMRGFNFHTYTPGASYRLLRFLFAGKLRACVLKSDHSIDFWVDDVHMIDWLHLIEQSIRQNHNMHQSIQQCIEGRAKPFRLMLNHGLEIDYSRAPLPGIFKEMLDEQVLAQSAVDVIKKSLNQHQVGVSFNSLATSPAGGRSVCTDISVLQDMRALDDIKDRLPEVYTEVTKRSRSLETGTFYVLEVVRGYQNGK